MRSQYKRTKIDVLREESFLRLCKVSYGPVRPNSSLDVAHEALNVDDSTWEMVQRTTPHVSLEGCSYTANPLKVNGAEVCAFLHRFESIFLILVAQYRPPVDAVVLEFPAGLVDSGEDVKKAALRELKEETGYIASEESIMSVTGALCYEPGMTDSCCQFVKVFVDGEKEVNHHPIQELDDNEDIEVILLPISSPKCDGNDDNNNNNNNNNNNENNNTPIDSLNKLLQERNKNGERIVADARLYMFLDGLSMSRSSALFHAVKESRKNN